MSPEGTPQTAVDYVLKHSKHTRNVGYVLIKLAWCIDQGNTCPSHSELAAMTGLTKPTIQHALGELEKDGTIKITRHGGDTKRGGKKNCYAIAGMATDPVKKPGQTVLPGKNDPVKPVVPGKEEPGKTLEPNAHVHESAADTRDAATRVTDLSFRAKDLSVKDTPLNPPTAKSEPIPPDGGRGSTSKPKRERKPAAPVVEDETYRRLLRGVALRSWGVDPDNPALKGLIDRSDFKRMGLIVSWLRGVPVTPEKLAEFYAWYKQQYEHASAPRDLEKFKGHYAAFIQSQVQPVRITNPAYVPVPDRPRMPVTELVSLDIVNAGRKAVPS